jgi:hypothetical protein
VIACRECQRSFQPHQVMVGRHVAFVQKICDACVNRVDALNVAKEDWRVTGWRKKCPPLYQQSDPARFGSWFIRVNNWQYGSAGLVIIGRSGAGKTRSVWSMLERHYKSGKRIIATDSAKFRNSMQKAARDGNLEWWQESLGKADILFFDDLGQMKMTDSAAESLWSIVERRCANERPIIVTTQYGGDALVSQFERQDQGVAIRRRLNEFCMVIEAKHEPVTI